MESKIYLRKLIIVSFSILLLIYSGCKKEENENSIVKDPDGNVYSVITIGEQTWLAENLKTTFFNDGIPILQITDTTLWKNTLSPACCLYNNDSVNIDKYGVLYNWYAVNTKKLCPKGWHIPSDNEWTVLSDNLGGEDIAGGKLKETGTIHWNSPNSDATDESHFTGLPGGFRGPDGYYYDLGDYGNWWSSTTYSDYQAWCRWLSYNDAILGRSYYSKPSGFSVRCIKD